MGEGESGIAKNVEREKTPEKQEAFESQGVEGGSEFSVQKTGEELDTFIQSQEQRMARETEEINEARGRIGAPIPDTEEEFPSHQKDREFLEGLRKGQGESGGQPEQGAKEEKDADTAQESSNPEEKRSAEAEEEIFDPEAHVNELLDTLQEIVGGVTENFVSQLHPDDLETISGKISRFATDARYASVMGLAIREIEKKVQMAQGESPHTAQELQNATSRFMEELSAEINANLSPEDILGIGIQDASVIESRVKALGRSLSRKQGVTRPDIDLLVRLLDRSARVKPK